MGGYWRAGGLLKVGRSPPRVVVPEGVAAAVAKGVAWVAVVAGPSAENAGAPEHQEDGP